MFSVFNKSILSTCHRLYCAVGVGMVRETEKNAFAVAHHPARGARQVYKADRGVLCCGRPGGRVGMGMVAAKEGWSGPGMEPERRGQCSK